MGQVRMDRVSLSVQINHEHTQISAMLGVGSIIYSLDIVI